MTRVETLFREYQAFHTDRRNKACHYVGITMIVLGVMGLLAQVRLVETHTPYGALDLAAPVAIAGALFYLTLDVSLGVGSLLVLGAFAYAGRFIPWPVSLGLFVVGWVFQFVGHAIEGKKPAFLRNGIHALVGPLWILSHLYEMVGLRQPLSDSTA